MLCRVVGLIGEAEETGCGKVLARGQVDTAVLEEILVILCFADVLSGDKGERREGQAEEFFHIDNIVGFRFGLHLSKLVIF